MDPKLALGFGPELPPEQADRERHDLLRYINLKLGANGLPTVPVAGSEELAAFASGLLTNFREKTRLLQDYRCPVDARIEAYLNQHFSDLNLTQSLRVPGRALVLDRHGLARELSLPANGHRFSSDCVESYRVRNGVLHNPRSDRRTTQGTFHVTEGGLPIPFDKRAVPRRTFVELFRRAVNPPRELLLLPFTSENPEHAYCWVSTLLRPTVIPEVPGVSQARSMEVRFFAPGSLTSNLDFVESIFGNAGDPHVPTNDAALDVEHWTGHTGCVILAPHLGTVTKQDVGLPHVSEATERQKRDRMCWEKPSELYNDGSAFKITCRDRNGVIVTLISDSYFGYCKKEVKTQISYATNLLGGCEEEHAGGAMVFPSWSLGEAFQVNSKRYNGRTLEDVVADYRGWIDVKEAGYGVDRHYPKLIYIPEDAYADLDRQCITWNNASGPQSIPLLPDHVYMAPSGYKIRMEKHPSAPTWRLIGTAAEGVFCHKPCTVSGGGKSEISKSLRDYIQYGPIFVSDFDEDMQLISQIFAKDYAARWKPEQLAAQNYAQYPSRPILSEKRSLGSVIKLLTPHDDYTDEYNTWLRSIPDHIFALIFIIKRFYRPEWGDHWKDQFSVDFVNGTTGHELKIYDRKLVGSYLRVGFVGERDWRTFKVRQDFSAAAKIQREDDISVSTVVPTRWLTSAVENVQSDSVKFIQNCEYRLFQRPDDAIHRGFDKAAEADLARSHRNFISNFEPMKREQVDEMLQKVVDFDAFTEPMQKLLRSMNDHDAYVVCSDNPRLVGGTPTKNPRYLQDRPDLVNDMDTYVAEMGARLFRGVPADNPVLFPVDSILCGRRNNPPDHERGIRSLAVYGPIHYQELPELFMDYICSLTGKSPSTTGAGSEGALTKGPFNCLLPAADLNAAYVSMLLTNLAGFSTAAGHIGPQHRFDHDLSLLVPEVWCRMSPEERDPAFLIENGYLERLEDFDSEGRRIPAGRLGYRITRDFVLRFFGRVFDHPDKVFDDGILKPELQDAESYADGILYICEAHERVAKQYFEDGSIDDLCPPLRVLVTIMAHGNYEGLDERSPEVRAMFSREVLLTSEWYRERLTTKQARDVALWQRHLEYLEQFPETRLQDDPLLQNAVSAKRKIARSELERVKSPEYLEQLWGTTGAQPLK